MLAIAKEKSEGLNIEYHCLAMEDLSMDLGSFDIVLSSLAFHYIKDFENLVENISKWLVPGGYLIFSVEHPVFTSYGTQDWYYSEDGQILNFPVDTIIMKGKEMQYF